MISDKVYPFLSKLLFFILWLVYFNFLFAINQMPIVWQTQGEQPKDQFGTSIVSIDYNADGYNDLVVLSLLFDPAPPGTISEPHKKGRIYFYIGGPDSLLSRTPTLSITRDAIKDTLGLFYKLLSADLNGDGLKDLIVRAGWRPTTYVNCPYAGGIYAFYSGAESDTLMDFKYFVPIAGIDSLSGIFGESDDELYELGDINGDGCDDLGFYYSERLSFYPEKFNNKFYILYGDPVLPHVEYFCTYATNTPYNECFIRGVGDINNDGFDDFKIMYCTPTENWIQHVRPIQAIIYGGSVIDTVITEAQMIYPDGPATYYPGATGAPIGDFNGDGIDDFIGYMGYSEIWYGENFNFSSPSITINDHFLSDYSAVGHGDFNNDGFEDIVFGNKETFNDYGEAFIYLGKGNPNGVCDLWIHDPIGTPADGLFGLAVAISDFNHDGCDDIAISAPYDGYSWPCYGKVYILEGNSNLLDTTTETNDETVDINQIFFKVFPNPFNPSTTIKFEIQSKGLTDISVYNVKGQKIRNLSNGTYNRGIHSLFWDGKSDTGRNIASGVYFIKISQNGKQAVKKALMIK